MPGPVSDSFDPEWGTSSNRAEIDEALENVYNKLSTILEHQVPIYILDLVERDDLNLIDYTANLTEKEWRLLRFALERARESL